METDSASMDKVRDLGNSINFLWHNFQEASEIPEQELRRMRLLGPALHDVVLEFGTLKDDLQLQKSTHMQAQKLLQEELLREKEALEKASAEANELLVKISADAVVLGDVLSKSHTALGQLTTLVHDAPGVLGAFRDDMTVQFKRSSEISNQLTDLVRTCHSGSGEILGRLVEVGGVVSTFPEVLRQVEAVLTREQGRVNLNRDQLATLIQSIPVSLDGFKDGLVAQNNQCSAALNQLTKLVHSVPTALDGVKDGLVAQNNKCSAALNQLTKLVHSVPTALDGVKDSLVAQNGKCSATLDRLNCGITAQNKRYSEALDQLTKLVHSVPAALDALKTERHSLAAITVDTNNQARETSEKVTGRLNSLVEGLERVLKEVSVERESLSDCMDTVARLEATLKVEDRRVRDLSASVTRDRAELETRNAWMMAQENKLHGMIENTSRHINRLVTSQDTVREAEAVLLGDQRAVLATQRRLQEEQEQLARDRAAIEKMVAKDEKRLAECHLKLAEHSHLVHVEEQWRDEKARVSRRDAKISRLEKSLASANQTIDTLNTQAKELTSALDKSIEEASGMRHDKMMAETRAMERQGTEDKFDQVLQALQKLDLTPIKTQAANMSSATDAMKANHQVVDEYKANLSERLAVVKGREEHYRQLKEQNAKLMDEARDKNSTISALKEEKRQLAAESSARASALDNEKKQLAAESSARASKVSALEEEKRQLAAESSARASKVSALEKEKRQLAVESSARASKVSALEEERKQLAAELSVQASKISALKDEKRRLAAESSARASEISALKEEKRQLAAESLARASEVTALEEERKQLAAESVKVREHNRELATRISNRDNMISVLQKEIQSSKDQSSVNISYISSLKNKVEELHDEVSVGKSIVIKLEGGRAKLQQEKDELERDMRSQTEALSQQELRSRSIIEKLEHKVSESDAAKEKVETARDAATASLEHARSTGRLLERELEQERERTKHLSHVNNLRARQKSALEDRAQAVPPTPPSLMGMGGSTSSLQRTQSLSAAKETEWQATLSKTWDLFRSFDPVIVGNGLDTEYLLYMMASCVSHEDHIRNLATFLRDGSMGCWYCFHAVAENGHLDEGAKVIDVCQFDKDHMKSCLRMCVVGRELVTKVKFGIADPTMTWI